MSRSPRWPRRAILQWGGAAWAASQSLPLIARESASAGRTTPRAKACILLYMDGGPSHLDLFDLKPDAPAEIRGPFQSIATSVVGTRVCEHLPRLAEQMHRVLQVRSVQHDQKVHDPAVYLSLTGHKHRSSGGGLVVEPGDLPHMASAFSCADRNPATMPKAVQLPDVMTMQARVLPGQNAGILGGSYDPFAVHVTHAGEVQRPEFARQLELTAERYAARTALLRELDPATASLAEERFADFRRQALELVSSSQAQAAFELERESAATRDRYGRHRHGQAVLLARRLVEAGTRFVTVYWGNEVQDWADGKPPMVANNPWDTHRNHFPLVKESLLPRADQTFAALLSDLAERGLLDETLVVWMGEFGRTPLISRPWASRDHWPHAYTILLAGAGIRGGEIYGRTDRHAAYVEEQPVSPADVTATIFDALGVPYNASVPALNGTRHRLSSGQPVRAWFG